MRAITKIALSLSAVALPFVLPATAQAQEMGYEAPRPPARVEQRISAEAFGGSGISSRYGAAYGARVGYTTPQRIFIGADATRYQGRAHNASETVLGGDIGMRFFPTSRFEVRPYALVGAAIENAIGGGSSTTRFALQPGLFGAYHLGAAYLGAEGRVQVAPTPAAASLLGTAGLTF